MEIRQCHQEEEESSWALERKVWSPFNWLAEGAVGVDYFPELHLIAWEDRAGLVATIDGCPMDWDGDPETLPSGGGTDMILAAKKIAKGQAKEKAGWVGVIGASVDPHFSGRGLSKMLLQALRAQAKGLGYQGLIAPVRPIFFARAPGSNIIEYAGLRLADGRHFDPWVRQHEELGGQIVATCSASAQFSAPRQQWEEWSGMQLSDNGRFSFPQTIGILEMQNGQGYLSEPSIWLRHDL